MNKKKSAKRAPITAKQLHQQKFLLIWSGIIVLYGIIFYYIPLGGWIMAFQNYKPKKIGRAHV